MRSDRFDADELPQTGAGLPQYEAKPDENAFFGSFSAPGGLTPDTGHDRIDSGLCLTRKEIADLTGRKYARAQVKALVFMGVRHLIRPDGSAAVLRADLSAKEPVRQSAGKKAAPRFDKL